MIKKIKNAKPSWQCRMLNFFFRYFLKARLHSLVAETSAEKQKLKIIKFRHAIEKYNKPSISCKAEDITINNIKAKWFYAKEKENKPIILYFHGGGFIIGSIKVYASFCNQIANICEADVLVFEYRLSPEHSFTERLEDVLVIYEWLLEHYQNRKVLFAGDSAGGGLALSTIVMLKTKELPLPVGVICFSPWTDLAYTGKSLIANLDNDPLITVPNVMTHFPDLDTIDALVSPLYADYKEFPPLMILVGKHELLLDDAVRVAEKAQAENIYVELEIWDHVPHAWPVFASVLPEGKQALNHAHQFIQHVIT